VPEAWRASHGRTVGEAWDQVADMTLYIGN
jgi:hypothetical protein